MARPRAAGVCAAGVLARDVPLDGLEGSPVANASKPFWKRPRPSQPKRRLTEAQRRRAREAARRAGRRYPNLVDNARVAREAKDD